MENLGIVGLADAGTNRLFSALTGLPDPGLFETAVGIAHVPDERLQRLAVMSESKKVVATGFEVVHIALPPGAKAGEGLGAKFVGSLRNCDAVLFVLRAHNGTGPAEPDVDLATLELELVMADVTTVEKRLDAQRRASKGDKTLGPEIAALERANAALSDGTPLLRAGLTVDELELLAPCFCLTTKPSLTVLHVSEDQLADTESLTAPFGSDTLAAAIDIEAEIAACDPADREEMRDTFGIGESVLPRLARTAYHLLGRRTFLTTGDKESRAWTFRAGAKAPECAGVIHSDLQRGFIRAEVIRWDELLEIGSWSKAKEAGKIRLEGKEYEVRDGDVVEIRFNV
jgi:GTP-binding protein YchF